MSALENFKKVVKESIASNKLSSSRVEAVKVAAAKCFDRAQPAKSEFLRLHYSAPASSKIVSLYLFDAIARHSREVVKKDGAGLDPAKALPSIAGVADPKATFVRAAKDFLGELATIVTEIAVDTAASVKVEQREKVDKVIDIWRRAGTFDADLLDTASSAAKRAASASKYSKENPSNGASQGRSTTPLGSPPSSHKRLRLEVNGSDRGGSATPPVPIGAAGLPSSLAALLGAQAGGEQGQADPSTSRAGIAPGNAQGFVDTLQSLIGASTSGGRSAQGLTAPPTFDLSQLTALQQLASSSSSTAPGQPVSSSSAVPLLPPPGPPPPRPPQIQSHTSGNLSSLASTSTHAGPSAKESSNPSTSKSATSTTTTTTLTPPWPPVADPSAGDLSTFDVLSFDPTQPPSWVNVGQRWYNSFGYMPALWEVGMNYLMVFQAALMNQGGGYNQSGDAGMGSGPKEGGATEGYDDTGRGGGYGKSG